MSYIYPDVLDGALNVIKNATPLALLLCPSQPADYSEASLNSLAYKIPPTVTGPAVYSSTGRQITIAAFSDGVVTGTGTATHWALVNADTLLASGPLSASHDLTIDNTFSMTEFDIVLPGPA